MNDEEIRQERKEYARAFAAAGETQLRKEIDEAILLALSGDRCPCSECEARR